MRLSEHVINENNLEIADNSETIQFNISYQLFLEKLLKIIRGNTIKYSSEKKKKKDLKLKTFLRNKYVRARN